MTRPRIRIGTLMLLVVIVAMAAALVVERRRSTSAMVQRDQARGEALSLTLEYGRWSIHERLQRKRTGPVLPPPSH